LAGVSVSAADPGRTTISESPNFVCLSTASGQVIEITMGDIDCITASDFGVRYDRDGDKYQEIGPFTCYSGNAMTATQLYQCVADTAEFAAYPE